VGVAAECLKELVNIFGDSIDLAVTLSGTDNEIVGEGTDLSGVEQDYITSLLI
jgi:hypothetical protein